MAVKTITIDLAAYNLLLRHKQVGQSFSQVIKEHFGSKKTVKHFREIARRIKISDRTLTSIETQIERRSRDRAKPTRL